VRSRPRTAAPPSPFELATGSFTPAPPPRGAPISAQACTDPRPGTRLFLKAGDLGGGFPPDPFFTLLLEIFGPLFWAPDLKKTLAGTSSRPPPRWIRLNIASATWFFSRGMVSTVEPIPHLHRCRRRPSCWGGTASPSPTSPTLTPSASRIPARAPPPASWGPDPQIDKTASPSFFSHLFF